MSSLQISNYPALASGLIGTLAVSVGVRTLFQPFHITLLFGIPLPPQRPAALANTDITPSPRPYQVDDVAENCIAAFVRAKGVRDISIGLAYFGMAYFGDQRAMGVVMLSHAVTGILDGAIVWLHGAREKAWKHWSGTMLIVGIGIWMVFGEECVYWEGFTSSTATLNQQVAAGLSVY